MFSHRFLPLIVGVLAAFAVVAPASAFATAAVWTQSTEPPTGGNIQNIHASQQVSTTAIAALGSDDVYVSADSGQAWARFGGATGLGWVYDAVISQDGTAWASGNGIARKRGGESGWTRVATATLPASNMFTVYSAPNGTIFAGAIYNTVKGTIWYSTDGGSTWVSPTVGPPINSGFRAFAAAGTTVVAGAEAGPGNGGLWISTNGGSTFTQLNNGVGTSYTVYKVVIDSSGWYAATNAGLYKSTTTGGSWSEIATGNIAALAVEPGGGIVVGKWGDGVYRIAPGPMTRMTGQASVLPWSADVSGSN
ncbi:MAG: hypothetical protein FDZ75_08385, partial [Actinobacteria bacterium]